MSSTIGSSNGKQVMCLFLWSSYSILCLDYDRPTNKKPNNGVSKHDSKIIEFNNDL